MPLLDDFFFLEKIEDTDTGVVAQIELNREHRIFDGHFPGNPVVPGVCMMEMVKEVLEKSRGKNFLLSEGTNVKFMNILNPQENTHVKLTHEISSETEEEVKLKCTISNQEITFLKFSGSFVAVGE